MSITTGLNQMQKEAVLYTEGPLLILAGAGSGKTRVLTHRIAHLVKDKKVDPWHILAITFTNKAAKEMKERIEKLVGEAATQSMWVSTFHSMCVRILRKDIHLLGYGKWFTIYDTSDQKSLIKQIVKNLDYNEKTFPAGAVLGEISAQKNEARSPEAFTKIAGADFRLARIAKIYTMYQQQLKENNALDFDDLLMKVYELLTNHPEVLKYYQEKFKYIHVDEYQDTNTVQYHMVRLLAGNIQNLCVVGDDDQSIYGWRGANIRNILDFERDFKGAKSIKLEQNYRSTGTILDAANAVVSLNTGRKIKKLWTENDKGNAIDVIKVANEYKEAEFIANTIRKEVMARERQFSDFAVLYRTNAQSRVLEEKMVSNSIPYRLLGGTRFYERKEIKDLLAYLRVVSNIEDDIAVQRVINVPRRGIGAATVDRIAQYGLEQGIGFYETARNSKELGVVGNAPATKVVQFITMMDRFRTLVPMVGIKELLEDIIDTISYYDYIKQQYAEDAEDRISNIGELISKVANYTSTTEEPNLSEFLEEVTLVADIDNYDENSNSIVLMTLHSAKGLEFPVVFMPGLEEGLFPSSMSVNEGEDGLEEERRLCYVGITRAREQLYLLHAECRRTYGRVQYAAGSRFLQELPEELKNQEVKKKTQDYSQFNQRSKKSTLIDNIPKTVDTSYQVNDKVSHMKFGMGVIKELEEKNNDFFATIQFDNDEIKTLSTKFARLKVIK
ncbi:MAG TPA: DNA helicase PcrA [Epulopiscium sp.]|nr:DNA helicase PcrA [Candidatus Epulonipiscium sp.]